MTTSYLSVHRWECPVLEYVDNTDIGRMATLAYRIVAQTGYNYLSSQAEQFESMEPTYKENDYISVFKQVTDFTKTIIYKTLFHLGRQYECSSNWGSPKALCHRIDSDKVGMYLIPGITEKLELFLNNRNLLDAFKYLDGFQKTCEMI